MLVWINNNFENISMVLFWLTIGMGLVAICLIPILEEYFWSRIIFFSIFFITLSELIFLFKPNSCNLARALNGQYGQHLVETKHFYSDKSAKELKKLSKNEDSLDAMATVWCNKKNTMVLRLREK